MLVLFYHAVMAFVVPLVVAERLLTSSGQVTATLKPRLARWIDERWFAVVFAAACGVVQTANSPSLLHTIGSTVSTTGFVLILVLLWKMATKGRRDALTDLLPRGWELGILACLLATQYIGLGILLRPEKLPGIASQATIWGLYAATILLLLLSLKRQAVQVEAVATVCRDAATLAAVAAVCGSVCGHFNRLPTLGGLFEDPDIRGSLGGWDHPWMRAARCLSPANLPLSATTVRVID